MKDKEQLNSIANQYMESGGSDKAADLYEGILKLWRIPTRPLQWKKKDELSLLNEVFAKTLMKFKGGDFVNLLSRNFRNAKIDQARRAEVRKTDPLNISDEDTPISEEIIKKIAYYDNVVDGMYKKKEADKLELTDFLLESSQILNDPKMAATIEGIKRGEKVNAIAKSLGLHHEIVKRRIRAISRHYDANRFGEISDYLAV